VFKLSGGAGWLMMRSKVEPMLLLGGCMLVLGAVRGTDEDRERCRSSWEVIYRVRKIQNETRR
jgi:hypothetical protein